MAARDIVVIGGSAGSLEPLLTIVSGLANRNLAIFVTMHIGKSSKSMVPELLSASGVLPAHHARDGEPIKMGHIYVAPPDYHLMVRDGRVHLSRGPRENGFRPAVDPLFRSAANTHANRVIGIILSGGLDDGSYGLLMVKRRGGIAIVQAPDEAATPSMPEHALKVVDVDYVAYSAEIAGLITRLHQEPIEKCPEVDMADPQQDRDMGKTSAQLQPANVQGPPSVFTCPECGGSLWELHEDRLTRFRCHLGHSFSNNALADSKITQVEDALWTALRALEEQAGLYRRMADRAEAENLQHLTKDREERAAEIEARAAVIRDMLLLKPPGPQ